ncbi:MAG: chaperone NapD [Nitrospirota bacterium]|nr:chaperone NapD [Nitrospirota bacterium]
MNISSLVVKTEPEKMAGVMESLRNSGLCEVHFHDEMGKIIVTIEGESISEEMKKMKTIQNMPDVLSADLAYSYSENEMLENIEQMKTAEAVPELLRDGSPGADDSGSDC